MDGVQRAAIRSAAQVTGPGEIRMVQADLDQPGPGEVRVRIEGCGVCASNLGPWAGPEWMTFPLTPGDLGHEAWGRIDALGADVDQDRLGKRVATFGSRGFATHEVLPADAAIPVPTELDGCPVPAEPLACALSIFRMARIAPNDRVAIIGIGFLGSLLTQLASRAGAEVIAISRRQESLDRAKLFGASSTVAIDDGNDVVSQVHAATDGAGCDVCIECTGYQWPLDLAGAIAREGGRLVIAGYHQDGPRQIDMQSWNWRALEIVNAHVRCRDTILKTMRDALDMWAKGDIDPGPLFTHDFPLHRLDEALNATRDKPPGFVKALVTMPTAADRCRLGFLGLGWIGRHRMQSLARSGMAEIVALADADPSTLASCKEGLSDGFDVPLLANGLEDVLAVQPDGVVIATPSAQHADQAVAALEAGAAVFCQKPLGRTAGEVHRVVEAARKADRLLAVDLSYRSTAAAIALRRELTSGRIGPIRYVDLTFHNAYGPDKAWYRDRRQAGGGCLVDLGTHLVDLALWLLDWPDLECRAASLSSQGRRLGGDDDAVEDLAVAMLETSGGVPVRLACSWNLPAGQEAVLDATIFGNESGASLRNIGGSFYDFEARRMEGCHGEVIASPPDDWGGRAAVAWLDRLSTDRRFDPECETAVRVAGVLDDIYRVSGLATPKTDSRTSRRAGN